MAKVARKDQHEGEIPAMTAADSPAETTAPPPDAPRPCRAGRSAPSDWVRRFLPGVAAGGAVLDLACGSGRHLRLARAAGHPVTGLDRDLAGLADLADAPDVERIVFDLEAEAGPAFPLAGRRFAGVIVTNYLHRPLLPAICALVADDGVLIYETFARGHERHGRPFNPSFLLAPDELLVAALSGGLTVVGYEHGELAGDAARGSSPKIVQRLAAVGPSHPWVVRAPRRIGV